MEQINDPFINYFTNLLSNLNQPNAIKIFVFLILALFAVYLIQHLIRKLIFFAFVAGLCFLIFSTFSQHTQKEIKNLVRSEENHLKKIATETMPKVSRDVASAESEEDESESNSEEK